MRVKTPAIRRSSSTERISEPSCSRWPLRLGLFVVVERAFDPVQRTMEQIDGRPEEVFEIRFEAACRQGVQRSIEDVGDRTCDDTSVGERSRVGFVLGAIAAKLELGQNVGGWGGDRRVRRRSSGDVRRDRAERDETGGRQDVYVRPGERGLRAHGERRALRKGGYRGWLTERTGRCREIPCPRVKRRLVRFAPRSCRSSHGGTPH